MEPWQRQVPLVKLSTLFYELLGLGCERGRLRGLCRRSMCLRYHIGFAVMAWLAIRSAHERDAGRSQWRPLWRLRWACCLRVDIAEHDPAEALERGDDEYAIRRTTGLSRGDGLRRTRRGGSSEGPTTYNVPSYVIRLRRDGHTALPVSLCPEGSPSGNPQHAALHDSGKGK